MHGNRPEIVIISHRHKFIFIKTNKTAGTSIEIALSRYCGPEDVITPISPQDEATRLSLGYPCAQNFKVPLSRCLRHYFRHGSWPRFYNHMSAEEVIRIVGPEIWAEYFTFCFERNPWDRAISLYHWRAHKMPGAGFSEFIRSPQLHRLKTKGADLYTAHDQILVDHIGRYENLADELEALSSRLELPGRLEAPSTKHEVRSSRPAVAMTPEDVAYIGERFKTEIQRFGYTYQP